MYILPVNKKLDTIHIIIFFLEHPYYKLLVHSFIFLFPFFNCLLQVLKWKQQQGGTILKQLRMLVVSLDWSCGVFLFVFLVGLVSMFYHRQPATGVPGAVICSEGYRRMQNSMVNARDSWFILVRALDRDRVITLPPVGVSLCVGLIVKCCVTFSSSPGALPSFI